MAELIDGKALARRVLEQLTARVESLRPNAERPPGLAVVLVGGDPASALYVRNKRKACQAVGIVAHDFELSAATSQFDLEALVDRLNADPAIDGILVQLPLPPGVDSGAVLSRVDPSKDVDGFGPMNLGRLVLGEPGVRACTPAGIMALIDQAGVPLVGKRAVVIGRSNIVGKPTALMLLARHLTVTVCHSRTVGLPQIALEADVLVAAVGQPELVRGDWVKPGAIVIDVGTNRTAAGKACGDVAFDEMAHAGFITPVPGGVGPMTVAMLMSNTVSCYESRLRQ